MDWTAAPRVGVILNNSDDVPMLDICLREAEAVTGGPVGPPGGGG
ncbi:hypothetical protein ABZ436_04620 [Micromonospora matsumotoense]